MQCIIVFIWEADEEEVKVFLQETYPFQKGPPWIDEIDGDPCLYIHFYNDLYTEYEPSEIEAINSYFEHPPSVAIVAYVSGRHIDNHPEYNFVNLFMSRYKSIADDCLSNHLWTLDEINSGYLVDGHPFFDVLGHYLDFKASNRGL